MAKSEIFKVNKKIADTVVGTYQKTEDTVQQSTFSLEKRLKSLASILTHSQTAFKFQLRDPA